MIPINVVTRWHQWSLFFGFVTGPALGVMLMLLGLPFWLCLASIFLGFILPPVLTFRILPRKDEMTIAHDRLTFQQRVPIRFEDIAGYNTDDYLKLKRPGQRTLILHTRSPLTYSYKRICEEFVAAIEAWQADQTAKGVEVTMRRTYFYGSATARVLGAGMIVGCIGIAVFAITMLPDPPYGAMSILVAGLGMGVVLVSKGAPGDA